MYQESTEPIKLSGVDTTTNVYSKLRITFSGNNYESGLPGETSKVREPDFLSSTNSGDANSKSITIIKNTFGFTGTDTEVKKKFADMLVKEYEEVYSSTKKYKGFYIGRYELSGTETNPTVAKGRTVLTQENVETWYNLRKACTNLVNSEYAQSNMIYGNQWDEVLAWLRLKGYDTDVDSSSWGNYSGNGGIHVSGYNESWKANNIYDLAGNYSEITQETNRTNYRVYRGGSVYRSGSAQPAAYRAGDLPKANSPSSTRAILYIN